MEIMQNSSLEGKHCAVLLRVMWVAQGFWVSGMGDGEMKAGIWDACVAL
jgi:hypothetical protein